MKKLIHILSVTLLSMTLIGCSTVVPPTQLVTIAASEPDANIFVNGRQVENPAKIRAKRKNSLSIEAQKPGFHVATRTVRPTISTTGVADIIGFFIILLPGIGMLTPGAWRLEETDIHLQMFRLDEPNTSDAVNKGS